MILHVIARTVRALMYIFCHFIITDDGYERYNDELYDVFEDEQTYCLSMLVTARILYKNQTMTPILGYTNHAEAPGE